MTDGQNNVSAGQAETFSPDFKKIFEITQEIATNPAGCWERVKGEFSSLKDLYLNFIVIVAAIPPIASFIKSAILGVSIPGLAGTIRMAFFPTLVSSIVSFLVSLVTLYVAALVIEFFAPKFGGSVTRLNALRFIAAVYSVAAVASALVVIPLIGWLLSILASLYVIYVFFMGITPMTSVPTNRRIPFFIVTLVSCLIINIVFGAIFGLIFGGSGLPSNPA